MLFYRQSPKVVFHRGGRSPPTLTITAVWFNIILWNLTPILLFYNTLLFSSIIFWKKADLRQNFLDIFKMSFFSSTSNSFFKKWGDSMMQPTVFFYERNRCIKIAPYGKSHFVLPNVAKQDENVMFCCHLTLKIRFLYYQLFITALSWGSLSIDILN